MMIRGDARTIPLASGSSQADKHHITGKPTELMRQLSHICLPGELIFDPFAGSGTTGVGALMEGRRFIGVEKIASYADVARRRMAAVEAAPTLFPEKFTDVALDLDYPEPEPDDDDERTG